MEELYRGARLAVASEWRKQNEGRLNELEREFLAASEALKVREEEGREDTRRRELEAAQILAEMEKRSSARLRYFLAGLAIQSFAKTWSGVYFQYFHHAARRSYR